MTTFGKKRRGWKWWKLGTYECLVCWAIQSLWCVYIFIYIYTIYTHIYFYVLKMKFPICSFSRFVLARKTHTQQFFNQFCLRPLETNFRLWRPCRICFLGSRRVPKNGDVFLEVKTQRWRMEWKKRKTPVYSWQDIFSILLPPGNISSMELYFLVWFFKPVGNWLD